MTPDESFSRHDWVWLDEDWRACLGAPLEPAAAQSLGDWIARERPLVVARRLPDDAPNSLRLGLALPGKRRLGFSVRADAVSRHRAPLYLLEAAVAMTDIFPEAGANLMRRIERQVPETQVFGSLAWRHFAGDLAPFYLTPTSDIDLLFRPEAPAQIGNWIALLQSFEQAFSAPRLDGEIALPDGGFVAWREFAARPKKVMVKTAAGVDLRGVNEIEGLFRARAA